VDPVMFLKSIDAVATFDVVDLSLVFTTKSTTVCEIIVSTTFLVEPLPIMICRTHDKVYNRKDFERRVTIDGQIAKSIDTKQLEWNEYNNETTRRYSSDPANLKNIFEELKALNKSVVAGRFDISSKIFGLLSMNQKIQVIISIGAVPASITKKIVQSNITEIIVTQINAEHYDCLEKSQKLSWESTLKNSRCRIISANTDDCLGDMMNVGCVHQAISEGLKYTKSRMSTILICDGGAPKEECITGKFDSWEVITNIITHPDIEKINLIICKIQNTFSINECYDGRKISTMIENTLSYISDKGFKFRMLKAISSWAGNDETHICIWRQELLKANNPLCKHVDFHVNIITIIQRMIAEHKIIAHFHDFYTERNNKTDECESIMYIPPGLFDDAEEEDTQDIIQLSKDLSGIFSKT